MKAPTVVPPLKRAPGVPATLVTVAARPAGRPTPALSPAASDWVTVQKIVDRNGRYEERLQAIHLLSAHLSGADWAALQPFLLQPDQLDRGQLEQVIKNRLLDILCAQSPPPAGLGEILAQIYHDPRQNEVIRDYAVQHLAAYYEQILEQPNDAPARQAVQDVLWEAVNEAGGSVGGTALLALKRISQLTDAVDPVRVAKTALQLANAGSANELSHITAYQVCAQLGATEALPVVLQAAQNGETMAVRLSAIGALGLLGGPDQMAFLNAVLAGPEERLKPAAQHALNQIANRQTQPAPRK